ncbi:Pantothenate synthetase [Desulfovibrio sp. X2]|uniref:pantoate--beta-alanine ligase n=1 Tax=Desulfovibrio sp. X2 TaxID=941449 RepID=UPI000358D295|nr:pantoate--beta-alanine ligase [Desulfovibrio sp. X2]EPR43920.1 Pantothenate synthetase [Desulfovibrio sp. X2]
MEIIKDPSRLQEICWQWRAEGIRVGLVPTMGYLHKGHASLMDEARAKSDRLVVSLFVNPSQFGPGEDLEAYPRDLERDAALAEEHGADVLFCPEPASMYPGSSDVWVEVPEVAAGLCGVTRPVHFRGVATVVTKLLMLAMPALAVFGEKDRQQLAVIRALVRALFIPVEIAGHAIVREADGLAMSSRNVYLTPVERAQAPRIFEGLRLARDLVHAGERDAATIAGRVRAHYAEHIPLGRADYVEIVHPETMTPLARIGEEGAVLAVAVYLGKARLIDNILLNG